jgi:hypothetical protein
MRKVVGQVCAAAAVLQFEAEPRRTGRAGGQRPVRRRSRIVCRQSGNRGHHVIGRMCAGGGDGVAMALQRAGFGVCSVRVQQHAQAVRSAGGSPASGLLQRVERPRCGFRQQVVGQMRVDRVARAELGAGQCEKQAGMVGHVRQQPAAAHVGEQADGDFGKATRERSLTTRWLAPDIRPMPPPITMPWPQHRIGLAQVWMR